MTYQSKRVIEDENGERITPSIAHDILKKYVWDQFLTQAKTVTTFNDDFTIDFGEEVTDTRYDIEGVRLTDLINIAGLNKSGN